MPNEEKDVEEGETSDIKESKGESDSSAVKVAEQKSAELEKPLSSCDKEIPVGIIDSKLVQNALLNLESKVEEIAREKCLPEGEPISFKVVFNKTKYDISFPLEGTVKQLKEHLSPIINVLPTMQKVMIKGLAKDNKSLKDVGVVKGAKIMVVGSKLNDLVSVNAPKPEVSKGGAESTTSVSREPFSKQKLHRKLLDKGKPEDATLGFKKCHEPLPMHPLSGMMNKHGGKVRLTFKLELDQVWVGTKERTEKINMSSIQQIVAESIHDQEEYSIVGLQLGPTEASRYWIYWVPSQYVNAIKDTVLGKW